ncbi:uncharacterized protein VTP21DRAFT_9662 [Calcarisporiella thermophila]|uniref:uncharacterized protein n=1 Tax=Calcarisporiella thermophila TaxID=911321 RepID=UPI0037423F94
MSETASVQVENNQPPNYKPQKRLSAWNALTTYTRRATQELTKLPDLVSKAPEEFRRSYAEFVEQNRRQLPRPTDSVPPWHGVEGEEELKQRILAISKDKRNFTVPPPPEDPFDMAVYYQSALATMQADARLGRMRHRLVPRVIKEEEFWHNYFYRVGVVKRSFFSGEPVPEELVFYREDDADENTDEDAQILFDVDEKTSRKPEGVDEDLDAWMDDALTKMKSFFGGVASPTSPTSPSLPVIDSKNGQRRPKNTNDKKEEVEDWEEELKRYAEEELCEEEEANAEAEDKKTEGDRGNKEEAKEDK